MATDREQTLIRQREQAERDAKKAYDTAWLAQQERVEQAEARLAKVPALVEALRKIKTARIADRGAGSAWPNFAARLQDMADRALTVWEQE